MSVRDFVVLTLLCAGAWVGAVNIVFTVWEWLR